MVPVYDCEALARNGQMWEAAEAQNRGLCMANPDEAQTPITVQAPAAGNLSMGIPFPVLLIAGVAGCAALREKVQARKFMRELDQERNKAYQVKPLEMPTSAPVRAQYDHATYGANPWSAPRAEAVSAPTMAEVRPPSRAGVSGVSTPSDTFPPATGDTPALTPSSGAVPATVTMPPEPPMGDPLWACPFDINLDPCPGEQRAVEWCIYQEKAQEATIKTVWGLSKNGRPNSAYQKAKARYLGYLESWTDRYALGGNHG